MPCTRSSSKRDRALPINVTPPSLASPGFPTRCTRPPSAPRRRATRVRTGRWPRPNFAPFLNDTADRLASSADYLRDKDMGDLIYSAQALARRQPMLFVGALFGVGLIGSRLMKDGDRDQDENTAMGSKSTSRSATGTASQPVVGSAIRPTRTPETSSPAVYQGDRQADHLVPGSERFATPPAATPPIGGSTVAGSRPQKTTPGGHMEDAIGGQQ